MVDRNLLFINPALVRAFESVQPSMPIPPSSFENLECEYCDNVNKDWRMEEIIDIVGPQTWNAMTQETVEEMTRELNLEDPLWGSGMPNGRGYQETNQYPYFVKQCQFGIFMTGVLGGKEALETLPTVDWVELNPSKLEKQIDRALVKQGIDISNLKILRRAAHPSYIDWRQMTEEKSQRPWNMLYKYRKLGSVGKIWPAKVNDFFWEKVVVVDSEGIDHQGESFDPNLVETSGVHSPTLPLFYLSMALSFPLWIFTILPQAHLLNFPYKETLVEA